MRKRFTKKVHVHLPTLISVGKCSGVLMLENQVMLKT